MAIENVARSPFGGAAKHVMSMSTSDITTRYRLKCGADIAFAFHGVEQVDLFECEATGYRFWRPIEVAGGEQLYKTLAAHWATYYRETRWEYAAAARACKADARVLEVGCGRGYFLRRIQDHVKSVEGVELNTQAVATKVTRAHVHTVMLSELLNARSGAFDVVCAFQVIEHLTDPHQLIQECARLLAPGGLLVLSAPNDAAETPRTFEDAFNLPPHHMGHFSLRTFERIAASTGFALEQSFVQRKRGALSTSITAQGRKHIAVRAARSIAQAALDVALWVSGEPGDNLLVVLRKQAKLSDQ